MKVDVMKHPGYLSDEYTHTRPSMIDIHDKPHRERTLYIKDADGDSNYCLEVAIFKKDSKPMVDLAIYQGGPHSEKTIPWEMSIILDEESVLALRDHLNLLIERKI